MTAGSKMALLFILQHSTISLFAYGGGWAKRAKFPGISLQL
jgi:hypothetical protein